MANDVGRMTAGEHPQIKTILLVEDDVNIGEVLVQAITQETPYHAMLVPDGFEALKAVKKTMPDLLILDYHLPRMTGIELYDQLHTIPEMTLVPAMMISARLPTLELKQRKILGMNKPIDLDDFLQAIEQLLA